MLTVSSTAELFNACNILFGPEIEVSLDFLRYLQLSGLKAAYRKKALETHPDRAKTLGENKTKMNEHFIKVTLAYEKLGSVLKDNGTVIRWKEPSIKGKNKNHFTRQKPNRKYSDYYFNGYLPKRKLLIGQFLYYSGCVSWKTYINAIIWQKQQRPLVGQIAVDWGILSPKDIQKILIGRDYREKFGEIAVRRGYLTPYKLMAILGKQRKLQCPMGDYFVRSGNLTLRKMETMVKKQHDHNRRVF